MTFVEESFSWWNSTCLRRLSVTTRRLLQDFNLPKRPQ